MIFLFYYYYYFFFSWILSDYTSSTLNLEDERIYRDLSKPMGALGAERSKLFQARYHSWDDPSGIVPSFHYGTHYSSAATVLYYLIRLEPFTKYNLHLQGGKFDHADRLFYDLGHTWTSASSQGGMSDVKELIPEFFYLPDFLRNSNRFDLGEHQRGGYVDDVKLPPWCLNDPRIFVRLHRKALESPCVSANLHQWIGNEKLHPQTTHIYTSSPLSHAPRISSLLIFVLQFLSSALCVS